MSGITGLATTFNLPNYVGELFGLTPSETPLLSAIGGLTGGQQASSTEFEWQTYDLRDPSNRQRLEGADAPTSEERVRANARNVVEVHQEAVTVSYTKQAAIRQRAVPTSVTATPSDGNTDPVIDEMTWQLNQAVKQIALDINWTFWNGQYNLPADNTTARRTRGLLQAITTNKVNKGSAEVVGLTSATSVITETTTALANGDAIVFTSTGTASNIVAGRKYIVRDKSTNAFSVTTGVVGNAAITLGTATGIAYIKPWGTALSIDLIDALSQLAYDNGGLSDQQTATIAVNSTQRVAITKAFASAYGQAVVVQGSVGGVAVDTVKTNFGQMNIMLDRHLPVDALAVVSLDQLSPVFLSHPEKGVFFAEPLAKTGAQDKVQLYGEIGLKYGNERAHALYRGLAI